VLLAVEEAIALVDVTVKLRRLPQIMQKNWDAGSFLNKTDELIFGIEYIFEDMLSLFYIFPATTKMPSLRILSFRNEQKI